LTQSSYRLPVRQAEPTVMRILVVEDQKKISRFIERGLREENYTVDVAEDGNSGLSHALELNYDLIILDVMLPGKDGFEILATLRSRGRKARIIMLTALDSIGDRVRGLEGGADDYLVKPFAFAELLARVRVLLRRSNDDEPTLLRFAGLELDMRERKVRRDGKSIILSTKEFGVLSHLMRHPQHVVTRTQLAEQVWDENFDPFSNVIDVTVYHLREKVDRGFAMPLIHTVRGTGYVLKQS
jgi:heavy metal response regulator